ncbi:MAG: hypothetical protein V4670_01080 [Bacteroidota bacterium]
MKNLVKTFIITAVLFFITTDNIFAQGPPPWAPAHGYRAKTRYVYFPDQNIYYDLQARNYIYLSGPNWVVKTSLPKLFLGINLGKSSQVELDFYGDRPYRYNTTHVVKYKKGKKAKFNKVKVIKHDNGHHGHGHGGKGHGKH